MIGQVVLGLFLQAVVVLVVTLIAYRVQPKPKDKK